MKMSFKLLLCALFCCGLMSLCVAASAQSVGSAGTKENLDLPVDAGGENITEEEDAPEVFIFYGQQLEGDGFFYCVDRSGSMQDRGELARAKQEISRNIQEFSDRTEFGVVFFDSQVIQHPNTGRPIEASPGMKSAALSWISAVGGGSGSCCQRGLLAALRFANLASSQRKVVCYVGDGGGTGPCGGTGGESGYLNQTLQVVQQQNYQRVTINTIGVMMGGRTTQETFLRNLSRANGGTYKRIN